MVLIDGSGREGDATVTFQPGGRVEAHVKAVRDAADPGFHLWLAVAAVRGERLAWAAEKAAELGVAHVVLVRTARTQSFRAGGSALERIERVVREAAKQSGSARWPHCAGPVDLPEALVRAPSENRLFVDFPAADFPAALAGGSASLLVGPEGGWTDAERAAAAAAGWTAAALPAGTLRAETAAVAAVVLARAALSRPHPPSW